MRVNPHCWLAQFAPAGLTGCDGRLDPCHLVPQRLLKVEFPFGVWKGDRPDWRRIGRGTTIHGWMQTRSLEDLLTDRRIIAPGCRQHHGHFDKTRKLKIPRKSLPAGVEEFARELGRPIESFLDREFGERLGI